MNVWNKRIDNDTQIIGFTKEFVETEGLWKKTQFNEIENQTKNFTVAFNVYHELRNDLFKIALLTVQSLPEALA